MTQLEQGDTVLCTVDRIVGTIVFVKIEGNGEGSIILSEIAPGRIRNLRDYVVPKKTIVCKILRIKDERIDLSLRRVTQKEKKEVIEQYNQEKSYKSILKSVLGEKANQIIDEIEKDKKVYEFLQEAKDDSEELKKITGEENSKKILEILNKQKQKKVIIKKELKLNSINPDGLNQIKEAFRDIKDTKIKYISAGNYLIKAEEKDAKIADNKLKEAFEEISKRAKQLNLNLEIKK